MKTELIGFGDAQSDLLSACTYIAERIKSSDGHAEALKEIVPFYLAKDDVDTAAELANSIDDPFARDRLLLDVAEKCAAIDDDEYAVQLAETIEDVGLQSIAFEKIAAIKAEKKQFDKAYELAEGLEHRDEVLAQIAVQQNSSGDEMSALKTLAEVSFAPARVRALLEIADEFQRKSETEKSIEYLDKAHDAVAEIEFDEEKLRTLISIGGHYLLTSRNDKAIRIFAEAQTIAESLEGMHRDNFLSQISSGFLEAGSLELADRALDLVKNKSVTASALAMYALHYHNKGEKEEALEILDEAHEIIRSERDNEIVDSRGRFGILGTIASRFATFGRPEKGIDVALEIKGGAARYNALAEVAQWCAINEKEEMAQQALDSIQEDSEKVFALISISDAKQQADKKDDALNLLKEAHEICQPMPQLSIKTQAQNHIATRLHKLGETDEARKIATENLETISRILDDSQKANAIADLSIVYKSLDFELNESEKEMLTGMLRKAGD